MIVLALDPGKQNYGFGIIEKQNRDTRGKNLLCGRLGATITRFDEQLEALAENYAKRIEDKIETYHPDVIVIERYMTRQSANLNNEIVNVAIGMVVEIARRYNTKLVLVGSATWKNYMQRVYNNNDMREVFDKAFSDHASDALGMGIWYLDTVFETQCLKDFADSWVQKSCSNCKIVATCARRIKADYCARWRSA